ncbi:hypothetical protein QBC45DRAFT_38872 [Copromyces sp. CBS 386.78]|nr:hypothetical protein QBC45DRAFT_38872 [Copromyces sp. CBS 386.78]
MRRQRGGTFGRLSQSRAFSFNIPTQRFYESPYGERTPSFASGIGSGRSWFGRPRTLSEIMSGQMAITGRERGRHSCGSSFSPPLSRYVKPGRKVLRSEDTTAGLTIMLIQIPPSVILRIYGRQARQTLQHVIPFYFFLLFFLFFFHFLFPGCTLLARPFSIPFFLSLHVYILLHEALFSRGFLFWVWKGRGLRHDK